ncbi:MAG: beta-lactamase domain protein [Amycolatopsis sp.]|uniref:MBL fold metallo-hydrolase n=1 Tax=Amycolatopsis sp. TaxID=37632 RepID=UPI00260BB716|nr:MBL fold metallo-hydrolase [Amycolatopsis sp.]MCU1683971.1 beta-lactamase domain protein [Amycolatopsis sp.]
MRIGDVTVQPLLDGVLPMPPSVLYPDVSMSTWRSLPGTIGEDGLLPVPFGGFLATDEQGNRVVFDLGGGVAPQLVPGGDPPAVRELLPIQLEKLGCPLDSVTDVVLSHLHIDHVGWASTDGRPVFPGARHHIHAEDWKHFVDERADEAVRSKVSPLGDTAALWDGDSVSLFGWLRLVHAPGHTPGSSVAVIESQGQSLALVGDLFHHPAALDHPDWRCGFDWDAELGAATRAHWAHQLRAAHTPLVGPHFPDLTAVTLR